MDKIVEAVGQFEANVEHELLDELYKAEIRDPSAVDRAAKLYAKIRRMRQPVHRIRLFQLLKARLACRERWRQELSELVRGKRSIDSLLEKREAALALRHGMHRAGLGRVAGRPLPDYLSANPEASRRSARAALESPFLRIGSGRPSNTNLLHLVVDLLDLYELVTGRAPARSTASATKSRKDGAPGGPTLRYLAACLGPIAPRVTDYQLDKLIRDACKLRTQIAA